MANKYPLIREFENLGDGIWRVDWFGGIEKNPSVESEYAVQIILSKLKTDGQNVDIASDQVVDQFSRRSISIGVGQIPLVHIGTLWENGRKLPIIAGHMDSFNLEINPDSVGIARATAKINEQTLIPFNDHAISSYGKDSWCLHISHNNDPAGIIIPAMEIIRFYYATSTLLSKATFNGDFVLAWNKLVNPDYTGMQGKRCVVHRRSHVEDNDCWTIGRVQNAPEAYNGVMQVLDSILVEHVNGLPAHPKTSFPFTGKTSIKARCQQVGWKHKRWLILSLISCSGSFPFDELEVIADNDSSSADPKTDLSESEKKPAWIKHEKSPANIEKCLLQSGAEPEANTKKHKFDLPEERFMAINNKEIIKTLKSECRYKSGSLKTNITPTKTDALGTGDGTYGQTGVTPIGISVENFKRRGLPASFETLVAMLEIVNGVPSVSGNLHHFACDNGLLEATLTKPSNRRQWAYLDSKKSGIRRFMVADLTVGSKHCCLIEVERRPASPSDTYLVEIIFHQDWHMPNSIELTELAIRLSKCDGRMKNISSLPNGLMRLNDGLRHTWASADEYATRVIEVIQQEQRLQIQ